MCELFVTILTMVVYALSGLMRWEKQDPAHSFFVPGLVGGRPTQYVVDDVEYYKGDEEKGTNG